MSQAVRASILGALAAQIALVAPWVAKADEAPSPTRDALRWLAPPECPSIEQLRRQIERLVKRRRGTSGTITDATGEVARDERLVKPYLLRLVLTDQQGGMRERRIEGETCAQVADAAAVVVALASDADEAENPVPAKPSPIAPPVLAKPPTPSVLTTAPRSEALAARPRRIWDIGVLGGVDVASLPSPASGVGLVGGVEIGPNRFELQSTAWLPRRGTLASHPTAGGDIALYAGALRYCRGLFEGVLDVAPCAGIEAGALVATRVGLLPLGTRVGPWVAPELSLVGSVRPSARFVLALELDGLVALERPQFIVKSAGMVFQPSPGTGRILLALHIRFP